MVWAMLLFILCACASFAEDSPRIESLLQAEIDAALASNDQRKAAESLISLADYYRSVNRLDEAETTNRRALAIINDKYGVPESFDALLSLGATLRDEGKYGEAEYTLRNALVIASHQSVAYNKGGQFKDINIFCNNVIANPKMLQGTPEIAMAYDALAELFLKENRIQDAQRLYERELQIFGLSDPDGDPPKVLTWSEGSISHTLKKLAEVYQLQGDKERAEARIRQSDKYR